MARKSMGKLIFAMAQDIRMLALGNTAFGIWVKLIALIEEIGLDGSLTFGMARAPSLADIARIQFDMTETELKTHLETQSKTQVLSWNADTQTLAYGPELQPSKRTLANRENGKKGGRPPGKHITERTDPAQRYLPPMSIKGGKSMPASQTQPKTHGSIAKLALTKSNKALAKQGMPSNEEIDTVYNCIGPKAFEAAGFDPARDMQNWSAARQWAADGLKAGLTVDEIERLVISEVSRIAQRQREKGKPATHLGYFGKAVQQSIALGNVPPPVRTQAEQQAETQWEQAMQDWMRTGCQSPQPQITDFIKQAAA
ncbi:hypothetical protein WG31_02950 [Acetobacter oryzifermentans]|uniref:Uncharacterized protein n=2 Tax=Acetobacter oryzifermentans TaxID=1633874 RepID=A0ABM6AHA8_9PROT|nr:hypothetical protein WG31_02950 [Acetobacter oryzifermentans]